MYPSPMDLQLTLAPALSKVMLLLTILVTFATVLGTNPPQGGEASWYNSALLISAGATGAFLSDNGTQPEYGRLTVPLLSPSG